MVLCPTSSSGDDEKVGDKKEKEKRGEPEIRVVRGVRRKKKVAALGQDGRQRPGEFTWDAPIRAESGYCTYVWRGTADGERYFDREITDLLGETNSGKILWWRSTTRHSSVANCRLLVHLQPSRLAVVLRGRRKEIE